MDDDYRDEISRIRMEILSLQRRLSGLERRISEQAEPAKPSRPITPPPLPPQQQAGEPVPLPKAPREAVEVKPPAVSLPPSSKPVTAAEPAPKKPALSLEQRVGASWLNKIGIVVLLLAAVFFFQYAVQRGWISPTIRVVVVALAGVVLLLVGEWTFRKAMRMFATGVTGGGIALLYASAYAASPKFYSLVNTPTAFALMCAVTVIGVLLSLRSGALTTAILVQIGAYMTPMLLSTGRDEQVILMTYLIVVSAGFLTVSVIKKWDMLPPVALAGTLLLFGGWYVSYYDTPALMRTMVFAWSLFGLFLVYSVATTSARRAHQFTGIAVTSVGAAALVLLWLAMEVSTTLFSLLWMDWNPEPAAWILTHLVILDAIILVACLLRRWHWLRAGAMFWTAVTVFFVFHQYQWNDEIGADKFFSTWIWVFFSLFTADILIRAWWRNRRTNERLDAVLATAATAAMFAATYALLHDSYEKWMGLYTASLAVVAFALATGLIRLGQRRILGYAYLGQGLILVLLAGSFEVNRYFAKPPADLPINAEQAEQMAHSIWWAVYAAGLLIIGFVVRYSPVRYFALALFAVTLGKVLLVDMAGIEAGYRIASFLALGVLLLAASFLYQRYFREALAKWDKR